MGRSLPQHRLQRSRIVTLIEASRPSPSRLPHPSRRRSLAVAAIVIIAVVSVISHRVGMFTNPQFYAEDGARWFADAYNYGPFKALGFSLAGYFQVVSRLGPVIAAPFGIANQPLIYNICGLLLQVAPAFYFLSSRFETVVPSLWTRLGLSAIYLVMPADTLDVTITAAPFHLVILATLVVIAPKPQRWYWAAFDVSVAILCGLSGPFAYILFPVALLWFLLRRQRFTLLLVAIFAVTLAAQIYAGTLSPRINTSPGASLQSFVLIVSDRIILAGQFGELAHTYVYLAGRHHGTVLATAVCFLALPICVFAALRAPLELRAFGLVALGIVAGGLLSPLVTFSGSQWVDMAISGAGQRYFFMAELAWVFTLMWAASHLPTVGLRRAAWSSFAVVFASGVVISWVYAPIPDYHWPQEARAIASATPGTRLVVPIPPGATTIDLIAK